MRLSSSVQQCNCINLLFSKNLSNSGIEIQSSSFPSKFPVDSNWVVSDSQSDIRTVQLGLETKEKVLSKYRMQ